MTAGTSKAMSPAPIIATTVAVDFAIISDSICLSTNLGAVSLMLYLRSTPLNVAYHALSCSGSQPASKASANAAAAFITLCSPG